MSQKKLTVMNKVLQSCMIALAATTLFSACQKDKEHFVDLTAVIVDQPVSNAKVYIDGIYGCWQHGDAVKIKSGSNGTADYALLVSGSEESATRATILDVTEGTPYTAGYPAANATITGNGTLTIDVPASQSYAEASIYSGAATAKQRIVCPMAAYSPDGSDLKFYNVAAMLAVTVKNSESSDLSLYAVEVESDKSPLSGTASVSVDANGASITDATGTSQSVTLTFGTTVTLAGGASRTVYIPVLPIGDSEGEKSTLTVHVKATANADGSGSKYTFHGESANAISIEANQIGNVPVTLNTSNPETEVNDYFWGQGTEECPFLIASQVDLKNLRNVVTHINLSSYNDSKYNTSSVYYKQTADIDLSSETTWGKSGSEPYDYAIGCDMVTARRFNANYDGDNHWVNLAIGNIGSDLNAKTGLGLFGVVGGGGSIKNLTVKGSIAAQYRNIYVGGLVGHIKGEFTIDNCRNEIPLTTYNNSNFTDSKYGGIIGHIEAGSGTSVTISNCKNTANIQRSGYGHVGGICAYMTSGAVTYTKDTNAATVSGTGTSGTYYTGGICGASYSTNVTATYSYCRNDGAVSSTMNGTGGIIGYVTGTQSFNNCENNGVISGTSYTGGIVGYGYASVTITNCINKKAISGGNASGGILGYGYARPTVSYCQNEGTVTSTSTGVGGIMGYGKGIDCSYCENTSDATIQGTHKIGGIIGNTDGSSTTVITNCKNFATVKATSNASTSGVAGIVGKVEHSATITRCINAGEIIATTGGGNIYVGGILGVTVSGAAVVKDCGNRGALKPTNAFATAGIVGQIRNGSLASSNLITNCYNTATFTITTKSTWTGGITTSHNNSKATVTNCWFSGSFSGTGTMTYKGDISSQNGSSNGVTGVSNYSVNQYTGTSNYYTTRNYSITQNGDGEYITSNSEQFLKDALNNWVSLNDGYGAWTSNDYTELPHLAWED